ncbi:MAG: hypothetical protein FJ271_32550 [Planctomycetes bacterium]|nr:hypothetical protein [Planctomycetota bacterium]
MPRNLSSCLSFVCGFQLALCGCSPSQATVTGKVTYQNKPLSSGEIHLIGDKGISRSALIGPLGTFEVKNAPVGVVKVSVVSYKSSGPPRGPSVAKKKNDDEPEEIVPRPSAIPEKYNNISSSELVFTISNGSQTISIDLKD